MPLVLLVILPWLGSLIAVMLPSNARNAESTAAGGISLGAPVAASISSVMVGSQRLGLRKERGCCPASRWSC